MDRMSQMDVHALFVKRTFFYSFMVGVRGFYDLLREKPSSQFKLLGRSLISHDPVHALLLFDQDNGVI
jgi:hypothetical protein